MTNKDVDLNEEDYFPTALIVDDDEAMRDSIEILLHSVNIRTKSFESAQAFIDQYTPGIGECLLVDVRMPGMSGLELQQWIIDNHVPIPIIILTAYANVSTAVRSMRLGAFNFIEKPYEDQLIIDSVQEAFRVYHDQREEGDKITEWQERYDSLSAREIEVMGLVTEGLLNKQIAIKLGVSERTVENHRSNLMHKMKTKTVAELVRIAIALDQ